MGDLTNLERLEAESLHIFRSLTSEAQNPVLLFSAGKDSAVLLHLALKAFAPAKIPFPILHIDTTWKFQEMISFRDELMTNLNLELIVHTNQKAIDEGIDPLTHDAGYYTQRMKTDPLKEALKKHGFDMAFGGARREEEASRAKERISSWRSKTQSWEPRSQRPEPWNLFNTRIKEGESLRVFPLSNWTEKDIWSYIDQKKLSVPTLYFSASRPTIVRDGVVIMVDDGRIELRDGEEVKDRKIRFRSLGCYPLSAAIKSDAESIKDIIDELGVTKGSERQGRLIDKDAKSSMENKKKEGYF